jgi:adenylyltransferase/sulfurtransferase
MDNLSKDTLERYSRHIVLPEIGIRGQQKLQDAAVLLVGAGGLGSAQAVYLAAAGVGRIGLIDDDRVALSNLQRQVIYKNTDVGRKKVEAARQYLGELNPEIKIDVFDERLESSNALDLCKPYDVILDGSDNFATRYLINDVCVLLRKPNVYGSVYRFEGQVSVFGAPGGPCYRCLYPYPPAPGEIMDCAAGGVFGALPGIIGSLQAIETIKLITGVGRNLIGRLLQIDTLGPRFEEIGIDRNAGCAVCGDHPVIRSPINYDQFCRTDEDLLLREIADRDGISPEVLQKLLISNKQIRLIDVREPAELDICRIEPAENIPAARIEKLFQEAEPERELIVFCRSGIRSARIVKQLREQGFSNVRHLTGGILGWIEQVDPGQPGY